MVPKDLDKLIEKYLDGTCTDAERKLIDDLYSSLGRGTEKSGDAANQNVQGVEARILQRLQEQTSARASEEPLARLYFWRYARIAASLIFLLGTGYYFYTLQQAPRAPMVVQKSPPAFHAVENFTADARRVILPDGSIVQMSPGSRIRYSTKTDAPARELFLEGEAYFDVSHNKARPFYVYAGNIVTKVLGTSFIVRAAGKNQKVTVSVKTGKVSVYSLSTAHKKTVLTQNQEAIYDEVTDLVATQAVAVEDGKENIIPVTEMHFEETPVSEVLRTLAQTYNIGILFDDRTLSGCVLTSSFFEEGLYDRIDVICTAIGATYKIVDARIVIESKGCNLKTD